MSDTEMDELIYDTLPPDAISAELAPIIDELGLRENCRQLAMEGWTVIEKPASDEFNARLRAKIKELAPTGGAQVLLDKDPVFVEAVMNAKIMAMAEFSVGRGFMVSQVAASVKPKVKHKGDGVFPLHADHNWVPAPFPEHNMVVTACWATTGYSSGSGATVVVPGSQVLRRHPNAEETYARDGVVAIECEPGSVAMWGGNIWHGTGPRVIEGERVVCHVTYSRMMMRPVENYSAQADKLIAQYGDKMSQLLGREDFLDTAEGSDPITNLVVKTFNNSKR